MKHSIARAQGSAPMITQHSPTWASVVAHGLPSNNAPMRANRMRSWATNLERGRTANAMTRRTTWSPSWASVVAHGLPANVTSPRCISPQIASPPATATLTSTPQSSPSTTPTVSSTLTPNSTPDTSRSTTPGPIENGEQTAVSAVKPPSRPVVNQSNGRVNYFIRHHGPPPRPQLNGNWQLRNYGTYYPPAYPALAFRPAYPTAYRPAYPMPRFPIQMNWQMRGPPPAVAGYCYKLPSRETIEFQNMIWDQEQQRRGIFRPSNQEPLFVPQREEIKWQTVQESRQTWEPLDMDQRSQDPTRLLAKPPAGFEDVPFGKSSLSVRARQLLGEYVTTGPTTSYPVPEPIDNEWGDVREQQHFIANSDKHLMTLHGQLRVSNGTTGDGHYVRVVRKLLPMGVSGVPTQSGRNFWQLLRSNQEARAGQQYRQPTTATATSTDDAINPDGQGQEFPSST